MHESPINDFNHRVKGTKEYWNRPERAGHVVQLRAADLRDDDQPSHWALKRSGSFFYRLTTEKRVPVAAAA